MRRRPEPAGGTGGRSAPTDLAPPGASVAQQVRARAATHPPNYEIPAERLPPGFLETVTRPPAVPVRARASAAVVLVRDGAEGGPEVLLLRRGRKAGFVPGAWVFPGGGVDAADGAPEMARRWMGLTPESAAARLGVAHDANPPALAYYAAAMREAFEETGLLPGLVASKSDSARWDRDEEPANDDTLADAGAGPGRGKPGSRRLAAAREALLGKEAPFAQILQRLDARLDGTGLEYIAHWVTPAAEPRRYDTRFFAVRTPRGAEAAYDEREMTGAVWLRPRAALERHRDGLLPMVFPTIRTLEDLQGFATARRLIEHHRGRAIPRLQPEIVRTATGVALRIGG